MLTGFGFGPGTTVCVAKRKIIGIALFAVSINIEN